jgi:endonuclease-8
MPEGHTLYRLAAGLREAFGGDMVRASSPQGRFAHGAEIIDGRVLETAESAGKHLFVHFDNDAIVHVHLGLYGTWPIADLPAPVPVGALRLRLVGTTAYADLRGPTQCELLDELGKDKVLARLGPDPLREHADSGLAYARIRSSSRPIGALLMDQSVLAGVGNVYRAEVLFRARLHPLTPGTKVTKRRWSGMWHDLVTLMADGVTDGFIDTVRPEHSAQVMGRPPRNDGRRGEVYVYRRHEQACFVCGSTVRTRVLEGRNLYWCPTCQRRR